MITIPPRFGCLALAAGLALAGPAPGVAQSALEEVERLARLGRAEEARAALTGWWEGDRAEASRRELQRGLWLRGRLTVDPVQAELDFQRLVVLYPSGQFTPDAILRLAQASWAMGDEEAARRYVATLERDYPRSAAREAATAWLADPGPLPPPGDVPTRAVEGEVEGATPPRAGEPEAGRAAARPAEARQPEERRPEARQPEATESRAEPGERAGAPVMNYYVQLGAFGDEARAFALYDEVRARGIDVRVVRVAGSQFTHVRVGRFAEREAAVELLEELTAQGIGAALVRDDRAEQPARN